MNKEQKAFQRLYVNLPYYGEEYSEINEDLETIDNALNVLAFIKPYLYIDENNTLRFKNGENTNLSGIVFQEQKVIDLLKGVLNE